MLDLVLRLSAMENENIIAIRDNIQRLLEHHGWTQVDLAKAAKVSQKTVSDLVNYGRKGSFKSPNTKTVIGIADAFGTTPWLLFKRDVPLALLLNQRIDKLVESYIVIEEKGRETVDRVAESETRYVELTHASRSGTS